LELAELAVRGTIWLSLLAWVIGEWRRSAPNAPTTAGRRPWTVGALAALVHSALAFHIHYGWSHADAYADTARQTAAVTGLEWGGGLYVNYAFLVVWTADALWWRGAPQSFRDRPRLLDRAVRAFLLFMFVNGAVVFARGSWRWLGAVAVSAVVAAWYRGAGTKGVDHHV
jgi:hypothetical protein